MTAKTNTKRITDAFNRAKADVASLADWIECELDKQDGQQITWASVGSLEYVREHLIETLAFLSGVEHPEIQRGLDELHS